MTDIEAIMAILASHEEKLKTHKAALEAARAKQRAVNEALLAWDEDLNGDCTLWTAYTTALREALK